MTLHKNSAQIWVVSYGASNPRHMGGHPVEKGAEK